MKLPAFLKKAQDKGWTVKVVPNKTAPKSKKEMSVFHFTSLDVFRVSFIGFLTLAVIVTYFLTRKVQETAAFQNLQTQLQFKEHQLDTVEQQKAQVELLLNQEANRLENHLKNLRKQEDNIKKLLGQKQSLNKQKLASSQPLMAYHPFANRSSRGGSYSDLVIRLASLQSQIGREEQDLSKAEAMAEARHREMQEERQKLLAMFDRIPTMWPVQGPITSGFGYRTNPVNGEGTEFHEGVDIGADYGTTIHASATGVVIFSGWYGGFGNTIQIDHQNGIVTQYSHCSQLLVHVGQSVKQGDPVGLVGSTGYSTGTHVHFGVIYQGRVVNPMRYLGMTFDKYVSEYLEKP